LSQHFIDDRFQLRTAELTMPAKLERAHPYELLEVSDVVDSTAVDAPRTTRTESSAAPMAFSD
jgi:hypothetical protein